MAFKVSVPLGKKDGDSGSSGSGGSDANTKAIQGLTKAVAIGNAIADSLAGITDGVRQLIEPLIRVLSALLVVIFVKFFPILQKLVDAISDFTVDVVDAGGGFKGLIEALMKNFDAEEFVGLAAILAGMVMVSFGAGLAGIGWSALILGIILLYKDEIAQGIVDSIGKFWAGVLASILTITGAIILFAIGGWVLALVGLLTAALIVWWDDIKGVGESIKLFFSSIFDWLGNQQIGKTIIDMIKASLFFAISLGDIITDAIKTAIGKIGGFFGGGRAAGGPVSGGTSYLVGENGPEIFSPSSSGNITPNNKLGGTTININNPTVRSDNDIRKLTQEVSKALQKSGNRRFS